MERSILSWVCVFPLVAVPLVGCSDETGGAGGSGGSAGSGGSGGTTSQTATLRVVALAPDENGGSIPLVGFNLCETGTTHCATSDEDGVATLQLPANQEISYTIEKPGYGSYLRADIIDLKGSGVLHTMSTDEQRASRYDQVMSRYPMEGTGGIFVQVYGDGLAPIVGATLTLLEASGKTFYIDEANNWRLDLTATTSKATGGFVEVSPGDYQIEIGEITETCERVRGWPGDSDQRIRVPVRVGYTTIARVNCN